MKCKNCGYDEEIHEEGVYGCKQFVPQEKSVVTTKVMDFLYADWKRGRK
ncbi:hypothetical protein LCGC14_1143000 [marine sediment metagenome]|uniref:Uncharacterized protein n=1 Tax=marine sediment metagenome TaxID=412755 RepID=A0A0F9PFW9_9ZZZZ